MLDLCVNLNEVCRLFGPTWHLSRHLPLRYGLLSAAALDSASAFHRH